MLPEGQQAYRLPRVPAELWLQRPHLL